MNLFIGCILLGFSMIANAANHLSMTVNTNQGHFVVKLAANPTTGFQWKLVNFDKSLFTLTSSKYQKLQTTLIGAGGQMWYTFTLNKRKTYPTKTTMIFKYARSWEANTATITTVTLNLVTASE